MVVIYYVRKLQYVKLNEFQCFVTSHSVILVHCSSVTQIDSIFSALAQLVAYCELHKNFYHQFSQSSFDSSLEIAFLTINLVFIDKIC